ncbi:MAG: MATE family efflux transporter [Synergistales bacterium]|nr:MATE family efflux transporter [Synergistales bacterium]
MRTPREKMLAEEPITKLIWKLSLPAMMGMFVNAMYNLVDTIYIGHGVGPLGIAGLSVAFPIQMIMGGTGAMFGIGAASIISRALGARDYSRAEDAFGNNLLAVLVMGFVVTGLGTLFLDDLLVLFGATEAILPYAREYLGIILYGAPLIMFTMSMNNVIRSEGSARVAMWSMIIAGMANIVLDPLFIFTLNMGIRGAAWATVLSRLLTVGWIYWYFRFGKSALSFGLKYMRPRFHILWEMVTIGFPMLIRHASSSFVFGLVNHLAALYGGDMAVALFGINNRAVFFSVMPMVGIAQGMQPILGFNYGAKRFDRAREVVKKSFLIATLFSGTISLIMISFPEVVISVFTNSREILQMGPHAMRLMTFGLVFVGFQMIGGILFQAIGKAVPSFILNTSRSILILVPLLLTLPGSLGLDGIWISFSLSDIFSFILAFIMVSRQIRTFQAQHLATQEV